MGEVGILADITELLHQLTLKLTLPLNFLLYKRMRLFIT
jgi:hypothetical protein